MCSDLLCRLSVPAASRIAPMKTRVATSVMWFIALSPSYVGAGASVAGRGARPGPGPYRLVADVTPTATTRLRWPRAPFRPSPFNSAIPMARDPRMAS